MPRLCTRCGAGCYGELCFRCKPRKLPKPGKHTRKDKAENKKFVESQLNHQGYAICSCCGSWQGSDADHIKGKGSNPHLRYVTANKRVLCRDCHRNVTDNRSCNHG